MKAYVRVFLTAMLLTLVLCLCLTACNQESSDQPAETTAVA